MLLTCRLITASSSLSSRCKCNHAETFIHDNRSMAREIDCELPYLCLVIASCCKDISLWMWLNKELTVLEIGILGVCNTDISPSGVEPTI